MKFYRSLLILNMISILALAACYLYAGHTLRIITWISFLVILTFTKGYEIKRIL